MKLTILAILGFALTFTWGYLFNNFANTTLGTFLGWTSFGVWVIALLIDVNYEVKEVYGK